LGTLRPIHVADDAPIRSIGGRAATVSEGH
jgi:hypothetical protein